MTTLLDSTVDGQESSVDKLPTHDRVRKARHKARHKRIWMSQRDFEDVLENLRRRGYTHRHRSDVSAIMLAAGLHRSDQDCPEFSFCDPELKTPVDVPPTQPGCWTFDDFADGLVVLDQRQREINELLSEIFDFAEPSCLDRCHTLAEASEILGIGSFRITTRP